jgi:N6-adenosine-specific RNA methylase IME4
MDQWQFHGLKRNGYQVIMADPPWHHRVWGEKTGTGIAKSALAHYSTMPIERICALPVLQLADEDCVLWLWCTNPLLDLGFRVMDAWGFQYKTAGSWEKVTKNGKQAFGTGYILRSSNEPFLIGTVGSPRFSKSVRSSFKGLVRGHSRKPLEGYQHANRLVPSATHKLELFSRESQPGWEAWGDEIGKFDQRDREQ